MNTVELLSSPLNEADVDLNIKSKIPYDLFEYLTTESSTIYVNGEPFRIVPDILNRSTSRLQISNQGHHVYYPSGKVYNASKQVVYDSFKDLLKCNDNEDNDNEDNDNEDNDNEVKKNESPLNEKEVNAKTEEELAKYISDEINREEEEGDYVSEIHIEQHNFVEHCIKKGFNNVLKLIVNDEYVSDYTPYFNVSLQYGQFELLRLLSRRRVKLRLEEIHKKAISTNRVDTFLCIEEYYGNKIESRKDKENNEDPFDRYNSLLTSLKARSYNIYTFIIMSAGFYIKSCEEILDLVKELVNNHQKYHLDLFMTTLDMDGNKYSELYEEELKAFFVGYSLTSGVEYNYF